MLLSESMRKESMPLKRIKTAEEEFPIFKLKRMVPRGR
jgi:hypothetical protein